MLENGLSSLHSALQESEEIESLEISSQVFLKERTLVTSFYWFC